MDRLKEFLQWNIDNPHNVSFKCVVGYEDREDTLKAMQDTIYKIDHNGFELGDKVRYYLNQHQFAEAEIVEFVGDGTVWVRLSNRQEKQLRLEELERR